MNNKKSSGFFEIFKNILSIFGGISILFFIFVYLWAVANEPIKPRTNSREEMMEKNRAAVRKAYNINHGNYD